MSDVRDVREREAQIDMLLRQRSELLREVQLGGPGAGQAVARLLDLDGVIDESETRLFCLRFILARGPYSPASTSREELSSYTIKKKKPETTLGVSLPQDFVAMARGDNHHIGLPGFDPNYCAIISRRVLLTGLPGSTTVAQVARGVAGLGGVINIFVSRDLRADTVPGQLMAVVEFASDQSATRYVHFVSTIGIWFQDLWKLNHQIIATKILTPSNEITSTHPASYQVQNNGSSGRCLQFEDFPVTSIWALFKSFGVRHIVDAWTTTNDHEDSTDNHLTVEFSSIFESTRCCSHLIRGYFSPYKPTSGMITLDWTTSDRDVTELEMEENCHIKHVDPNHIEQQWNQEPFNLNPSTQVGKHVPSAFSIKQAPLGSSRAASGVTIVGDCGALRHVTLQQITARISTEDARYILVHDSIFACDKAITTAPRDLYYSVVNAELSRLKEIYLFDPAWATFWDEYSKTQGIDLRGYYAYAHVAATRRAYNDLHGLPQWHSGEMLEQAAIPDYILSYSQPNLIRRVISTSN
ncbi:hypothetical protein FVEN_g5451 [Fusarium venenatum]|uniref:RRM domain-containing protein n=1 Tax=Fusarium venenatum TaxID=56646 RepID=A0A2L2TVK0_9HYPO|nr:uncharacterized protein FVRRES_08463 [Fusarium venenatum]KAG8356952.1 hypothetical protein FVEN_g5451 [Fusarium venenatum]KAH6965237.1 hypothetical protein EDB82DRAFT_479603 [Fusarium venenatum]CEI68386.1 unnamed protein product [Fusarium venenatum]